MRKYVLFNIQTADLVLFRNPLADEENRTTKLAVLAGSEMRVMLAQYGLGYFQIGPFAWPNAPRHHSPSAWDGMTNVGIISTWWIYSVDSGRLASHQTAFNYACTKAMQGALDSMLRSQQALIHCMAVPSLYMAWIKVELVGGNVTVIAQGCTYFSHSYTVRGEYVRGFGWDWR